MEVPAKIDEIDAKILKSLLKDARTSFAKIAKDCGVSHNTVVKHFQKLQQSGVVIGTSILTRMKDFGYQYPLSVDINVVAGKEQRLLEILGKMPNIRSYYQVVGKYDIHAVFHVKNLEEIEEIRDNLKKEKAVKRLGLTATLNQPSIFPKNISIKPSETK